MVRQERAYRSFAPQFWPRLVAVVAGNPPTDSRADCIECARLVGDVVGAADVDEARSFSRDDLCLGQRCFLFVDHGGRCAPVAEQRSEMVVTGDEVLLRKGPGLIYGAALDQPLHGGTELMLLDERRDWMQVELSDGRRGWAFIRGIEVVSNDVGFGSQRFAME